MKTLFAVLLFVVAFAASGCAPMGVSADLQVSSAQPPPSMAFDHDPQFRSMSNHRVSAIQDENFGYDMFGYGGSYYLYNGGTWYRSSSARGQFVVVEARRVPRPIFDVDDREYRWRNHPEGWRSGQMRGNGQDPQRDNNDRQGR